MKLLPGDRVGQCRLYVSPAERKALLSAAPPPLPPEVIEHLQQHHRLEPLTPFQSPLEMDRLTHLFGLKVHVVPKLSARGRRALELIQVRPNTMAWPGQFADAFWSDQPDWRGNPAAGHEAVILQRRNKVGAPVAAWMAAGYLGRLRRAGLIEGGHWLRGGGRDALRLTELGHMALRGDA